MNERPIIETVIERVQRLFCNPGKADCTIGGQYGSEGKGAAVAWLADTLRQGGKRYDLVTTNASSQAGHTAIHHGQTYVTRHLPTAPLISPGSEVFLNAGCAIDPDVFEQELIDYDYLNLCDGFSIHPMAAVITPDCIEAEGRDDSAQTKISSTRKGVGQALARKALRSGMVAKDHPLLKQYVIWDDMNFNRYLRRGRRSVLVEIPQGFSLSNNGRFYPYCTSRDCTVVRALADAQIHPSHLGETLMVLRTYPIRVGSLPGHSSGDCYPDQVETSWDAVGITPELTTVTGRQRRVFTWSHQQIDEAFEVNRPGAVFLTHIDYVPNAEPFVLSILLAAGDPTLPIIVSKGGSTADAYPWTAAVR